MVKKGRFLCTNLYLDPGTSILSAELLNVHRNETTGRLASTSQLIFAFSTLATPWTRTWLGRHVGESKLNERTEN